MANAQPKAPPQGRQINTNLMTQGSILKEILLFSIPLILGNLLQQMYNTVDSIIVGNAVGSGALAAVGSGTSLINLIIGFSQGVAVGAGVVISQFLGAENHTGVKKAVHTAITISAFMGVIVTLVGFFFSGTFLQWMGTPADVLADSTSYLRIYSLGLIFNVLYNMATGVLNAAGNSRRPLLYLGIASGTNIVLDIVFIAVLGMGVQGAALATDISQALSCLLALAYLVRVPAVYRVEPAQLRVDPKIAARIVRIGLPTGIQNMVISFSNVLVQSTVNQFGSKAMAGFTAYMKVDGFNILPVLSFGMALTTFTGQNYGAGKYDRVKKGTAVTLVMSVCYTIVTGVLLLTFQEQILRLFTNDAAVIGFGTLAMHYLCPFYWLLGIMYGLAGTVRGAGRSIPPMVILLFSLCVFRIFWVWIATPHFSSIDGIYMQYPITWVIGASLMALYTWKGKWMPRK